MTKEIAAGTLEVADGFGAWRENREGKWYHDIGYALQDVLRSHRYAYERKGIKPDDPGWHECSCGNWQGYWSGFEPHVADHLRVVAVDADRRASALQGVIERSEAHLRVALGYEEGQRDAGLESLAVQVREGAT